MDDAFVNEIPLGIQKAISITPKITGMLSILGSSWIFLEVVTDKRKLNSMYHRLMLGISTSDVISSFWTYFLSNWMLPTQHYSPEATPFFGASGNWITCNLQGFMFQVGIATPLYNGALSLYYVLLLKYNWTPKQMARRIEPYLHGFIITFALVTSIIPIFLTLYNPSTCSWCLITEYPYDCVSSSDERKIRQRHLLSTYNHAFLRRELASNRTAVAHERSMSFGTGLTVSSLDSGNNNIPCIRGHSERFATLFQWLFNFIPIWIVIVSTTVNMILIYRAVRNQEKKMESKYKFHGLSKKRDEQEQEQQRQQEQAGQSPNSLKPRARRKKKRESERIFTISILYTSSFYATFGCYTVLNALSMAEAFATMDKRIVFAILILNNIFLPLEGFFNCIVYVYPRYQRYKEHHAQKRYEEYLKEQALLEQQRHHSSANLQSTPNIQLLQTQSHPQPSTQENIVSSTAAIVASRVTAAVPEKTLDSTSKMASRSEMELKEHTSTSVYDAAKGTSSNPILIHATSNVSDLGLSNREQSFMKKQYKVPPIKQTATWGEKVKHFCQQHLLPDFESLRETLERGWTREHRDDDDYKLGGEECSIMSMMSTDALGNVTPQERNRGRSDSSAMIGTSIAFDHPSNTTTNFARNDNCDQEVVEENYDDPQFQNISMLHDSVARMKSTTSIDHKLSAASSHHDDQKTDDVAEYYPDNVNDRDPCSDVNNNDYSTNKNVNDDGGNTSNDNINDGDVMTETHDDDNHEKGFVNQEYSCRLVAE